MPHIVVVGAGFTGLAAAYELAKANAAVTLVEADASVGGLAGSFEVGGQAVEKFYHHWFTSDVEIDALVAELGLSDRVLSRPTRTGTYFANTIFRLSRPLDLLRYKALAFPDRIRLGLLVLAARRVKDWKKLEHRTAEEWLRSVCGPAVYAQVWQPLLEGKFGTHARRISAVWIWNKLVLRGQSRGPGGSEMLRYFEGGFAALSAAIAAAIERRGGTIRLGERVTGLVSQGGRVTGVDLGDERITADAVILTPALPIVADLVAPIAEPAYTESLRRIDYLGNACLTLVLDRSLSDYYWLNINDPTFPFVGVIEHTNFEPPEHYAGRHIVYLSKYLETSSDLYRMSDAAYFDYAVPYIQRIFPEFQRAWAKEYRVHRAEFAQPLVVRGYGRMIPSPRTPFAGLFLATMAQIYPEDRGTNYAVRDGRRAARMVLEHLSQ